MKEFTQMTMKDIAAHFGTSVATVSRALKDSPRISVERRKAIQEFAREHNFCPNMIAESLRNSKVMQPKIIGVIIPEFAHYFFSTVLAGIEEKAREHGYRIMVAQSGESYENEVKICQSFFENKVCGIIVSQAKDTTNYDHFNRLIESGVPLVFYDRICTGVEASRVVVDDYKGAFTAVEHMISTGCKRIAFFGSPMTLEISKNRFNGYKDALLKHGLTIEQTLTRFCDNRADAENGPFERIDSTQIMQIVDVVKKYNIDTIYNLAAILSATAEKNPMLGWNVGIGSLVNCLEVARTFGCAVFTPSSIGAFGPSTPRDNTPQDTIQRPNTIYGVTKVTGELLSDYYFTRFGVDTRSVRFPGLISNLTLPGGGTTDYAVEIYYAAVKGEKFFCPIAKSTFMDMMYMPDALDAMVDIMEADPSKLIHRNSFNVTAMSFDPEIIYNAIKKYYPNFEMEYKFDPIRQAIADSWPNKMDDSCARNEWGWNPKYDLDKMTVDMIETLKKKLL